MPACHRRPRRSTVAAGQRGAPVFAPGSLGRVTVELPPFVDASPLANVERGPCTDAESGSDHCTSRELRRSCRTSGSAAHEPQTLHRSESTPESPDAPCADGLPGVPTDWSEATSGANRVALGDGVLAVGDDGPAGARGGAGDALVRAGSPP